MRCAKGSRPDGHNADGPGRLWFPARSGAAVRNVAASAQAGAPDAAGMAGRAMAGQFSAILAAMAAFFSGFVR